MRDDALHAAFRATLYHFDSPAGELRLKVDVRNPLLASLLNSRGVHSVAALTAFNPQGRRRDETANKLAQIRLHNDLQAAHYELLPGRNEDAAEEWVEESVLVLGITLTDAHALATRYDQLAFLWSEAATATPRLVFTAPPPCAT